MPPTEYRPRDPSAPVLYAIVRDHFETFRAESARLRDGDGLPRFVEDEFRAFLRCGFLAGGFARFRCGDCPAERLVAFSCKGRGFCPSCGGRRMAERGAHLVDHVLHPPAVERSVGSDTGAAIMWVAGMKSVKELGGKVPTGPQWIKPIRKMVMFDNLIRNTDRNAGNILIGGAGDMILIDHSRAVTTDRKLQNKMEPVDAELWERIQTLTRENLSGALGRWLDDAAIMAILQRRDVMVVEVNKLVAKKGRDLVVIT